MNKIEVIGLGAGNMNQLPLGIYKKLVNYKQTIYARTVDHPVISQLMDEGVSFESFDYIYEVEDNFSSVYERIANLLIEKSTETSVVYAVPGHPMLAEKSVQLLIEKAEDQVSIIGGQSYLDALFTSLQIDPIDGFQFIDGTSFERRNLQYEQHLIFCQVYDQYVASEIKLQLLEDLPSDYEVAIIDRAGMEDEKIKKIPLVELDREFDTSNLTTVYVPPVPSHLLNHTFSRLREVIAELRGPNGCPWDKKQTHTSLREYAIEEVYELIEAIDINDEEGIIEELGDILLQVMLHSQIGEDEGYFTIDDVIRSITEKMIYRHPHVFGDVDVKSITEINKNWDLLKREEKGKKERPSVLSGVPNHLPSLLRASELQKKAAKVGFEWDDVSGVWDKLKEELDEVEEAIHLNDVPHMEEEFGDVLFVLANLTRYYKVNPEMALHQANQKFISRFTYIENKLKEQGKDIDKTSLEEMDLYWEEAKKREE